MNELFGKSVDFLESRENFSQHRERFYFLKNVSLKNTKTLSVFFDSKDYLISETLDEHIYWQPFAMGRANQPYHPAEINRRKQFLITAFSDFRPRHFLEVENAIDLTHSFGWYPFGHLFDSLQRLYSIRSFLGDKRFKLIVSKHQNTKNFFNYLSILSDQKIAEERVMTVLPDTVIQIQNLIFSTPRSAPSCFEADSFHWIREKLLGVNHLNLKPQFNLYLDRNGIRGESRNVRNNPEIIDWLVSRGFKVLNGSESLEETISYFANAHFVVGAHGALFSNTIFCNPDTRILEFCPKNRVVKCYRDRLRLTPHYSFIEVDADEKFNITIGVSELERVIRPG